MFENTFYFLRKIVKQFISLDSNVFIEILIAFFIHYSVIWFDQNNIEFTILR